MRQQLARRALDRDHRTGHQVAPELFEIRDDGFLYILDEEPPDALRVKVDLAIRECPTGAITVEG